MQHQQGPSNSNIMNNYRLLHNQDRDAQPDNFNWKTKPSDVSEERDVQSVDNILDRSGLLDELVCQILDDGTTPVEEEKASHTFRDAVNVKEFVPSCHPWPYGNNPNCVQPLNGKATAVGLNVTDSHSPTEQLNMGQSLQDTNPGGPHIQHVQPFTFKGKHVTSTGKVINPPPGFEQELQTQTTNLNNQNQSQINPQNPDRTKSHFLERDILGQNMLSSDMFSPNQSPSNQSNSSDYMPSVNTHKPFPDSGFDYQQRPPFQPTQMAQSLLQRRTNSPMQLLLSETGSGSSPGSIDSPILSPSSDMSYSNPSSPFETNMGSSDKPIAVSQASAATTRFNFKAPPFFPVNRPSPSPLGWKGADNNPFKFIQQRSESPVDQRPEQKFPFSNMSVDPPPTNRMLRGNFPMQPLPLPFGAGKPFSTPQDIPNFRNTQSNFLQKNQSQQTAFYNSQSGRNSPFPFPSRQPPMGPHGDSFSSFNRFGQHQATFSGLKQQGFSGVGGFPNKFPNSSNAFAMQQLQQHQQQQQGLGRESPTGRLHIQLDECCIHVKRLEEERKKTEYELARMHPGKRISSSNTIQAPQLPENPSQVDRIIVDVYKEHSRLVTLMSKIEGLCTESLHPNLEACLDTWMTSIQQAEGRRQQEIRNATQRQQERSSPSSMNEEEVTQLADGIEKMKNATRAARTALWCAFQMAKQDKENKES